MKPEELRPRLRSHLTRLTAAFFCANLGSLLTLTALEPGSSLPAQLIPLEVGLLVGLVVGYITGAVNRGHP